MNSSNSPSVEVKNFSRTFIENGKEIFACRDISFNAEKNSITGILGQNGAGKSTLIKSICGIQYPTSGFIKINDCDDFCEIRKSVSYVSENAELEENLTVKEILYLEAQCFNSSDTKEISSVVKKAAETFELEDVLLKKAKNLSKGFRQRVNLAKAICKNSSVIVLDELSSGLDPIQVKKLSQTIKKISKNRCIIFSTHRINEIKELCDKVIIMKEGRIILEGSTTEIIKKTDAKSLEEAFEKSIEAESNFL